MGMGFSDEESSDYEVALGDRGDFDSDEIMDDSQYVIILLFLFVRFTEHWYLVVLKKYRMMN